MSISRINAVARFAGLLFLAFCTHGCKDFVYYRTLDGPYRLTAIDSRSSMTITYELDNKDVVSRVGKTVIAVGWNEKYLVAKRHPPNSTDVVEYFYLDRGADSGYSPPSKSVSGPLSEAEFTRARKQLHLPDFTVTVE